MIAILSSRIIINVRKAVGSTTYDLATISVDPLNFAVNGNGTRSSSGWRPETHSGGASVVTVHGSVHRPVDTDGIEMNCKNIAGFVRPPVPELIGRRKS